MNQLLAERVKERFGVLPNFFGLPSSEPDITPNLWDSHFDLILVPGTVVIGRGDRR